MPPEGVFGGFAGWLGFVDEPVDPASSDGETSRYQTTVDPFDVLDALDSSDAPDFGDEPIILEFDVDDRGTLRRLHVEYIEDGGSTEIDLDIAPLSEPAAVEEPPDEEVWPGPESCG